MATPVDVFLPQVTRIPIAGPAPYNTLVAVSAASFVANGSSYGPSNEIYYYPNVAVGTPFVLQGFDQRVAPQFEHSTMVSLVATGPSEDDHFLFAIDGNIQAGFSPYDGSYYVTVDTAIQIPDNMIPQGTVFFDGWLIAAYFSITSYVLVYEPPIAQPPGQPNPPPPPPGLTAHSIAPIRSRVQPYTSPTRRRAP